VLDALASIDSRTGHLDRARAELEAADRVAAAAPHLWSGDRVDAGRTRAILASAAGHVPAT
jgi:hypothetical protein